MVDGRIVAAAEEERFSRRKHGKPCVPFSTWELPEQAAAWCLEQAGIRPSDLDAVAYSYDPALAAGSNGDVTADEWEGLRTLFVERAPSFLVSALPGLDATRVHFVPHHMAHAASAYLAGPAPTTSVIVLDGRGECSSYLAGQVLDGRFSPLARQGLPHSLGLRYEEVTEHLGFRRSSDEYKVMAMAAYGKPRWLSEFRAAMHATSDGGFVALPLDLERFVPRSAPGAQWHQEHADLAASMQRCLEETLLEIARWLHARTGDSHLAMAGGVALNCVANSRLAEEGPFRTVWIQPAAGDSGTALGAALLVASRSGDRIVGMHTAALGRSWTDDQIANWLEVAALPLQREADIAEAVGDIIARNGVVAWFQGRSEYGPRALGHRSLLANASYPDNLSRLNDIKGREQFRPVAPMVLAERAADIFDGPLPSPFMLFTQRVKPHWAARIPAALHVDGTARVQTVDRRDEPLVARMLQAVERRTGIPLVINTSLNTAGRPMVDDPRDALECFGSAPVDAMALGSFLLRRELPTGRSEPASDGRGAANGTLEHAPALGLRAAAVP